MEYKAQSRLMNEALCINEKKCIQREIDREQKNNEITCDQPLDRNLCLHHDVNLKKEKRL